MTFNECWMSAIKLVEVDESRFLRFARSAIMLSALEIISLVSAATHAALHDSPSQTLSSTLINSYLVSLQIYLSQYGYLSPKARNPTSGGNLLAQEAWETAIRDFQGFAGLNITGKRLFRTSSKSFSSLSCFYR